MSAFQMILAKYCSHYDVLQCFTFNSLAELLINSSLGIYGHVMFMKNFLSNALVLVYTVVSCLMFGQMFVQGEVICAASISPAMTHNAEYKVTHPPFMGLETNL